MKVTSEAWYMVQANLFPYQGQSVKLRSYKMREQKQKGEEKQAIENSVVPRNENQGSGKAITQTFE